MFDWFPVCIKLVDPWTINMPARFTGYNRPNKFEILKQTGPKLAKIKQEGLVIQVKLFSSPEAPPQPHILIGSTTKCM